jgi:REP element-mobilizing transposase RayT
VSHQKSQRPAYPDDPLAYFITWTVYGTFLQGDGRGWRKRCEGNQLPQPRLANWHQERLNHAVLLLSPAQRETVEQRCERHCEHRGWRLWEVNARSNHVHVVVSAPRYAGDLVRDQLKANCTRTLRERWPAFAGRPVWTHGGDWECLNGNDDLEAACLYVREAQDRMEFR